jgi:hypothetical protein
MGLDAERNERAECKPEGDGKEDVTDAGHGSGSPMMGGSEDPPG